MPRGLCELWTPVAPGRTGTTEALTVARGSIHEARAEAITVSMTSCDVVVIARQCFFQPRWH